jgi:phosphoserine phosphatase
MKALIFDLDDTIIPNAEVLDLYQLVNILEENSTCKEQIDEQV